MELDNLTKEDFEKILTVPENAITKQHQALLGTEGIRLEFTDDAISEIASMAYMMNEQNENIGARRLSTILEKLLEDISYEIYLVHMPVVNILLELTEAPNWGTFLTAVGLTLLLALTLFRLNRRIINRLDAA